MPLITGIKERKSLLWLYALVGFSFDIVSTIARNYTVFPNKALVLTLAENIFLVTEFLLIAFYYRDRIFKKKQLFYTAISILIAIYTLSVFIKSNHAFNFIGGTLFDFTCIIFAVAGFYSLLKRQEIIFLDKSKFFWVNVAFLVYCSGNFLVFLFSEYLIQKDKELSIKLWIFHNILNIIFSILIAISFSKRNADK